MATTNADVVAMGYPFQAERPKEEENDNHFWQRCLIRVIQGAALGIIVSHVCYHFIFHGAKQIWTMTGYTCAGAAGSFVVLGAIHDIYKARQSSKPKLAKPVTLRAVITEVVVVDSPEVIAYRSKQAIEESV